MNTVIKQCLFKSLSLSLIVLGSTASWAQPITDPNAEDVLNLKVKEQGVYQVTHQQLVNFGLDINGEPIERIALMNTGQPVQIELTGSAVDETKFGPGASIRFLGEGLDTLYTDTNVYTLRLDSAAQRRISPEAIALPQRVPFATSYLATKTYAPQKAYSFASPDENDPWFAERVLALSQSGSATVELDLQGYTPGGNSGSAVAKMNMKVWGGTEFSGVNDDHHVIVSVNNQQVIDETFDGFVKKEMSSQLSNLKEGLNSIRIDLPLDHGYAYEAVNLDSVSVSYPKAFEAENDRLIFSSTLTKFRVRGFSAEDVAVYRNRQGTVTRLSSASNSGACSDGSARCSVRFGGAGRLSRYFVVSSSGLLTPELDFVPVHRDIRSGNAEYLIITHPDFIASAGERDLLGELVESLEESFASVGVIDVEQVYAQFGNHIFDPQAIRDYIKFAFNNRGARNVLLIGGDVYDYRGFENQDARSFIPSIYMATGDVINFAPVDAKYVDLNNNNIPDLPIGRLPVRSMQELDVLLAKRTAYLDRNYATRALFAADAFDLLDQYSFKLDAESVRQDNFGDWAVETAYVDDLGVVATRAKIISEINSGTSLTSFFGHSSTNQWSFSGLFNGFDAASLNNIDRPTIVTQWGCWNTYYVNPNEDSMGHRFMMEGNRGAVAVMGATTLTSASNEKILARLVFERLTNGETLGDAVTNAKIEFAQSRPAALDVILGWTLLGPPELKL